jgi:hypothetical protein
MRRIGKWLSLSIVAAAAAGVAQAQEAPHAEMAHGDMAPRMRMQQEQMHQMGGMGDHMAPIAMYAPPHLLERGELLGLSEDQVSRLEALKSELHEAHQAAQSSAQTHHEQMMALWAADAPDVGQLRSHAEAAMEAQHAAHLALLSAAAQAKALLTPEQRGRVAGWLDARHMMMKQRMQRMMQGGMMQGRMQGGMGQMECCKQGHKEGEGHHPDGTADDGQ